MDFLINTYKFMKTVILFLVSGTIFSQQGVGIGTLDPQQMLHIASTTETIRVE